MRDTAAPVAASAAPERVRTVLDRLGGRADGLDDASQAAVVAVAAASDSLGDLLVSDAEALAVLADLDRPVAVTGHDPATLARAHRRERLRVAARDLLGLDDLTTTVAAVSAAAVALIEEALALAEATSLVVVGMGKLGARELNYVSDVDVMFATVDDPVAAERRARRVLDVLGRAVRVDTALRPGGRDGSLVHTLDAFTAHWERWAEAWEFQALLKADPVAGPVDVRAAFADAAERALWERPFDAADVRAVRRLKARAELEAARRTGGGVDVKRDPGGIRDIEFAAQLLQLVHGRSDPALRRSGTLDALAALAAGGYVDEDEADIQARAYEWLRRIEHRLQLVAERQTHTVPVERDRRRRIARALGLQGTPEAGPTARFDEQLALHRLAVRRVHESWYFRPLLGAFADARLDATVTDARLSAFGFGDPVRARAGIAELSTGLTRSNQLMRQTLPLLLDWLAAGPDPDRGLVGLRRLADGEVRARGLVSAFRDSAAVARRTCDLVSLSETATELLVANPDLIAQLDRPETFRIPSRDELVEEAWRSVSWRSGVDAQQAALRRWYRRRLLGVVARDVGGDAQGMGPETELGSDRASLAEVAVEVALRMAAPTVPVAVIGMGRLGGRDLSYASDIDLVFVHDGVGPDAPAEAERVATTVLRILRGTTPAGRIIDVDADLRPEGRSGPLARSLESYTVYLERWAETWERLALLRARPVAGDATAQRGFAALVDHAIWTNPPTADDVRIVRRMKARVESERLPRGLDPTLHLKLGPGGLADVEWTVQLLQWRHGVRVRATMPAIDALVAGAVLSAEDAADLERAHQLAGRIRDRAWLVSGVGDVVPETHEQRSLLARALDHPVDVASPDDLGGGFGALDAQRRAARRARRVVERCFYGDG